MSEVNEQPEQNEIPEEFNKIIKDFMNDLIRTFPDIITNNGVKLETYFPNENDETISPFIYAFCKEKYPKLFFDILYENSDIFNDINVEVELLPGINFTELWNSEISETTKSTIWKYLQLILFCIVSNITSEESFGDTAKLFEAINEDEFKKKIEETISQMKNLFNTREQSDTSNVDYDTGSENNNDSMNFSNLPNAEELHKHINGMMDGKLGSLAKEIAEETANDLNINMEGATSVDDVFKRLFTNPTKLMDLVKNVGSKLDNKIKSGEIKESELLEEASALVDKMKTMPGMDNLENMFSKMGIPGMGKGSKVDMNAFHRHMEQNMRSARMKDRMRSKLHEKEKEKEKGNEVNKDCVITSKGVNIEGMEELTFATGESVEKSNKYSNKKKNRKRAKKR
uniref:Uncharacterized protein n=1 Tax=viral metagenome TaxID=1070528 RepID=A0A6C0AYG2_9ZZZZ|tara:strand:- start:10975 stop:12171 length:1197 start_codon:yes stop_codon:yes gene_type:complete